MAARRRVSCVPSPSSYRCVQSTVAAQPHGSRGLFGPPLPTPNDAPLLDRLIGLTGRDPAWLAGGCLSG